MKFLDIILIIFILINQIDISTNIPQAKRGIIFITRIYKREEA